MHTMRSNGRELTGWRLRVFGHVLCEFRIRVFGIVGAREREGSSTYAIKRNRSVVDHSALGGAPCSATDGTIGRHAVRRRRWLYVVKTRYRDWKKQPNALLLPPIPSRLAPTPQRPPAGPLTQTHPSTQRYRDRTRTHVHTRARARAPMHATRARTGREPT